MCYLPIDIAAVSVDQVSVDQVQALPHASCFDATFTVFGCHSEPLAHGIQHAKLTEPFNVISMQSCMYIDAFENDAKAHRLPCQQICNVIL